MDISRIRQDITYRMSTAPPIMNEQIIENSVGITTYLSVTKGFHGILKQRYSDFIVREVSIYGEVTYLKSICGKDLESLHFPTDKVEDSLYGDNPIEKYNNFINEVKNMNTLTISDIDIETLESFIISSLNKSDTCSSDIVSFPNLDKVSRTAMHTLFKKYFKGFIETETVQINNISMIKLITLHKKDRGIKRKFAPQWPTNLGNYLRFSLLKENIDTMNAINILNKSLHCSNSNGIAYSGTKDKRGVTAQKCTIYRRKPSEFIRINNSNILPSINIGDFEYVKEPSTLGDLGGNRFELVLRSINNITNEDIINNCHLLSKNGFINYFGLQRFGKGGTKSHEIGKEILKSNWITCINMLFTPKTDDRINIAQAKALFYENKYIEAMKLLPDQMNAEKCVLKYLIEYPNEWYKAYQTIPKNARLICFHAYQSYLWNKAVSKRIELYGLQCVVGDLVFDNKHSDIDDSDVINKNEMQFQDNSFQRCGNNSKENIKIVTVEDIENKTYIINDVVLPLPGTETIYPDHEISKYYIELLHQDELTIDSYHTCDRIFREKGAYRRIIQVPIDFQYNLIGYNDLDEELASTELSKIRNIEINPIIIATDTNNCADTSGATVNDTTSTNATTNNNNEINDNSWKYKALLLKFTLPPGTYATMLLRELTRESTESQFQAQLTKDAVTMKDTVQSIDESTVSIEDIIE